MKSRKWDLKEFFVNNKKNIMIIAIILAIFALVMVYNNVFSAKKTYTVVKGYVEKTTDTLAAVVKNETIVELSKTDIAMPIIEQYKKVAKNETIAVYKNSKYEEYLKKIDDMDKQIQTLIQDLPITYSNDISQINLQITELSKEANKVTSYVKMQEYKNKIDELSYTKVSILGQISPAGSKIRELITQREEIEKTSKESADSIKSPVGGLVTYKIDKLEDAANIKNINRYSVSDIDNIFKSYNKNDSNNFGIKLVDNYLAYILVKEPRGENDKYIKEGNRYKIKLNDKVGFSFSAKLIKNTQTEEYNYTIFEITNGIENIVDSRMMSVEVVWQRIEGMAVPNDAIHKDSEKGFDYVTIINGSDYINIPIVIKTLSDTISIIANMDNTKREELGITTKWKLEGYDQVVIDK